MNRADRRKRQRDRRYVEAYDKIPMETHAAMLGIPLERVLATVERMRAKGLIKPNSLEPTAKGWRALPTYKHKITPERRAQIEQAALQVRAMIEQEIDEK